MSDYLFGIKNSNRDFSGKKSWGKNQFNTSFPAALTRYMYARGIKPIYVTIDENLGVVHRSINQEELLGCKSFDGIFSLLKTSTSRFQCIAMIASQE